MCRFQYGVADVRPLSSDVALVGWLFMAALCNSAGHFHPVVSSFSFVFLA